MAKITEAELKAQIKTADFSNAYLIFLVRRDILKIII